MAATVTLIQSTGASETTAVCNYIDLKTIDDVSPTSTAYKSYPIQVYVGGVNRSFAFWGRLRFEGSVNSITNIKFWKTMGIPDTGITMYCGSRHHDIGYTTPTTGDSVAATTDITTVTTEATALDLTPTGAVDPASQPFSKYLVLQMDVADTASLGNAFTKSSGWTARFQWTES